MGILERCNLALGIWRNFSLSVKILAFALLVTLYFLSKTAHSWRDYFSMWVQIIRLIIIYFGSLIFNLYNYLADLIYIIILQVSDFSFDGGVYWEMHQIPLLDNYSGFFNNLKFIKIKGFKYEPRHEYLVKVLLRTAIVLQSMVLVFRKSFRLGHSVGRNWAPIITNHFLSWRVSPQANISIYFASGDKSPGPKHSKIWFWRWYIKRSSC